MRARAVRPWLALTATLLGLGGCASVQRVDAAGDVHALLTAVRDNDRPGFERHIDRPALKRQIEARLLAEARGADMAQGLKALGVVLAEPLADLAGDVLIQPRVFRSAAEYYGYDPARPLPSPLAIAGALEPQGQDQVCVKDKARCLLTFTHEAGTWRLTGFDGDLDMLGARR